MATAVISPALPGRARAAPEALPGRTLRLVRVSLPRRQAEAAARSD
ncbi:MAG: hypothetical protein JSS22_05360 [Proteobacteria bacterium]|nr:hypothetical protein [Pseudomonadota bacterium]